MVQIVLFPLSLHPSQHHMSIKINISCIRAGPKQGEDGATAILNLHGGCLFSHRYYRLRNRDRKPNFFLRALCVTGQLHVGL